jgi:hypothetical protein
MVHQSGSGIGNGYYQMLVQALSALLLFAYTVMG